MLTKRLAIKAMFMGALAKMAHADEPLKPITPSLSAVTNDHPATGISVSGRTPGMLVSTPDWTKPKAWSVNLDMMTALHVTHGGEEVVITAAEIFAALKS